MREAGNIRQAETLDIDMMGFIFYPKSPRYVDKLPVYMPSRTHRTGVFVNEKKEIIERYASHFSLNYIQLHGNESPEYCRSLQAAGFAIIKAFSIATKKELQHIYEYEPYCRYFLFDTKCPQYGGSGNRFDWDILHDYQGKCPFLLSGGINSDSTKALKEFSHPLLAGFDLNSRFEILPGIKDVERIKQFLIELSQPSNNE